MILVLGMAVLEIASAEDIFDVLAADASFAALTGTINFSGSTEAALVVTEGLHMLDNLEQIDGLLVTIERDPQVTSTRYLTAQHRIDRIFTLRLIQFARGPARNLQAAITRLMEIFPGATAIPVGGPDLLAGEGQAIVRLPSNPVAHL